MTIQNGIIHKGISYDVGTNYLPGTISREVWNKNMMYEDMRIIHTQLNCNSIGIYGTDIQRLVECATAALEEGLHVWLQPRLVDASQKETLDYLSKVASEAEQLRKRYNKVTFNLGCELSIFTSGIIPGRNFAQRAEMLSTLWFLIPYFNLKVNAMLKKASSSVREHFKGDLTYGAGAWERVDWKIFDIIGLNYYMDSTNKARYVENLKKFHKYNKPIAITEFGCCCFEGAEDLGGGGFQIINWDKPVPQLKGYYTRNEDVQTNYICKLIEIFEKENIYGAFVFTYMETSNHYSPDPLYDLDMASYGIVRGCDTELGPGEAKISITKKKAFAEIARHYK